MVLLIPSGPPIEWQYQIRAGEYAKYGIEWRLTGDVYMEEFEMHRQGFNKVMHDAIVSKYGAGFDNAIAFDGSSSATLMQDGVVVVQSATYKIMPSILESAFLMGRLANE